MFINYSSVKLIQKKRKMARNLRELRIFLNKLLEDFSVLFCKAVYQVIGHKIEGNCLSLSLGYMNMLVTANNI